MHEHQNQSAPGSTPIEPTVIASEPQGPPRRRLDIGPWLNRALAILAFAFLALCLLGVFFVLPRLVERPAPDPTAGAAVETSPVAPRSKPGQTSPPAKMLDQKEAETQRETAQSKLANILETADALETRQVKRWAADDYGRAQAEVEDGEKAYREQRYEPALAAYDSAMGILEALQQRVPEVVTQLVDDGFLALTAGDSAAATQAFEFALAIEPRHGDATKGLARANTLDQVLALVLEAEGYERLGNMDRAEEAYQRALKLDAQAPDVSAALSRIRQLKIDRRYRAAMSKGFAALAAGRFSQATTAFEEARKIKPHGQEVDAALRQTENQATTHRIKTLIEEADQAAGQEQWTRAAKQYGAALKLDADLPLAAQGKSRATERARLDEQLVQTIKQPLRLSDNAVYGQATALRDAAAGMSEPGPRLSGQIATLSRQLKEARTPITVNLNSDGLTQVTVYKLASIGRFEHHELALNPGRYTVVGIREGYRDVRIDFSVVPNEPGPTIQVQCEEKLAFGD